MTDKWQEMALKFLMRNEPNATVESVGLLATVFKQIDEDARVDMREPKAEAASE
jgi:hypothetical protein